jgi:hypothetical protein
VPSQIRIKHEGYTWIENVIKYIIQRQNEDGGYTFCQGTESNAQDTYYGLAVLKLLGAQPPRIHRTVRWLRDFPTEDLYALYYVSKALRLCGEPVRRDLADRILAQRLADGSFGTIDVYVEVPSEFESTFMATELMATLDAAENVETTIDWLLRHQNSDGGFGAYRRSNLRSTFHAIASLRNLGYPVKSLDGTVTFVRSCEQSSGGFSVVPTSSTSYMEDTYCGVLTLDILGQRCMYPEETASRILKSQNSNGGFRRSVELGISTFEDTYFALAALQKLGRLKTLSES